MGYQEDSSHRKRTSRCLGWSSYYTPREKGNIITRPPPVHFLDCSHTCLQCQEEGIKWTHEIENYLRTRDLPEESKHAHKVRMQAARFTVIGDRLYWQSFGGPYLICLDSRKAQYVLVELYEGICGSLT